MPTAAPQPGSRADSAQPRRDATRRWRGRNPFSPLTRWEIALLWILALLIVAFGGLTLKRSAYMTRRMTDAGVYFRAAWALRVGEDPYQIRDNNWWTYLYPPPLAVATMPLADPPKDVSRHAFISYPASVVVWYVLGVAFLVASVHWTASALEASSRDPRVRLLGPEHRRWWVDRTLPMLVCLPAIGSTLSRGQVNFVMLASLGAMGCALIGARLWSWRATRDGTIIASRPGHAGAWLAVAACVKMYPAYIGLYALAARKVRLVLGAIIATIALMVAFPAIVLGPERMAEVNQSFVRSMLLPQLGLNTPDANMVDKVDELQRATGNQSFMAVIHGTRHLQAVLRESKIPPTSAERLAHAALSAFVTLVTLVAIVRALRRNRAAGIAHPTRDDLLAIATLATAMLPISPVCHNHYFALHMPLVAALIARQMDRQTHVDLNVRAWALIAIYVLAGILPRLPGLDALRPLGMSMYAGLGLWILGVRALWLGEKPLPNEVADAPQISASGSSSSVETTT